MKVRGFTLIELMIVVAVLAILAAIAIPAYNRQVEKTRRADAQSSLLDAAQRLERCFTRANTYIGCAVPAESQDGFYTISITRDAVSYTLTATSVGSDECSPFTLDERGARAANAAGTRCWGN